MRQRNDTGHVVDVAAYPTDEHPGLRPFSVGPGEVIDFPDLLAGFTETDQPSPAEAGDAEESASAAKTSRKRAEKAPAPEGDES